MDKVIIFFICFCCLEISYAAEKDKYLNNGKVCYWRTGKYKGEVCRDALNGEDLSQYSVKNRIYAEPKSNKEEKNTKSKRLPTCESQYYQKYNEALYEALYIDPFKWQDGYASPKAYAEARARLWVSLGIKYKSCE